jgi:hypothetical protein
MSVIGKYIYGIFPCRDLSRAKSRDPGQANSNREELFGSCPPADSSPEALAKEEASARAGGITTCEEVYPPTKIFGVWVYTIPYQDISAVVSDSEIVDYTRMLKDAVGRQLVTHQKVIEGIMPEYTIIPMRLGTFASDENEVRDILNKGYRVIKEVFGKIKDKIEIDVVATWSDFNSVLKEVGEEKEIKEFKERLLTNPEGITVDDQMKVGVMVKKALDKKREKCALEIQTYLRDCWEVFRIHALMDDKMVINAAFLINNARQKNFDRKVEELNTKFAEKLNFRCVGPLPPYSFYTLEIKKMQFKDLDWARKKLKLLNGFATKNEIKKAHQTLAFSSHPDKNPDTPGIEKEFDEITKAYRLLLEYCLSAEQGGKRAPYSLREEEFDENAIIVKVRE